MIVYPISQLDELQRILRQFPDSPVKKGKVVQINGMRYQELISMDYNLLKKVVDRFPINQDPIIEQM